MIPIKMATSLVRKLEKQVRVSGTVEGKSSVKAKDRADVKVNAKDHDPGGSNFW